MIPATWAAGIVTTCYGAGGVTFYGLGLAELWWRDRRRRKGKGGPAMTRASSGPLSAAVGPTEVDALRRFRHMVEDAFPGRLRSLVLFGSPHRDGTEAGREWEVAVFIEGFDRDREGRRLGLLAAPFHHEGFAMPPIGLSADRRGPARSCLPTLTVRERASRQCSALASCSGRSLGWPTSWPWLGSASPPGSSGFSAPGRAGTTGPTATGISW